MPKPQANRTGQVELLYNPYQVAFLEALKQRTAKDRPAYTRLSLFSGRRGGKTRVGGLGATELVQRLAGSTGLVCAPTYPALHDFVMPAFFQCFPEDWIADWSQEFFTLRAINGATVSFRSLDNVQRGRGFGLDWCWIDEAREVSPMAWDTLVPSLADKGGQAIITTSPNGFDWCYKKFWLPAQQGEPGFWACKYRTLDNPFIQAEEIAAARKQLDPLFFAQEFEADFVTFTGAVYGTAVTGQVLHTPDAVRQVLPEWPRINSDRPCLVGIDPGADHPFAIVVFVATEKGLVQVGEHLARNRPVHEHIRALNVLLQARSLPPLQLERVAIDRSARQMAIELAQHNVHCAAAENNVVAGIQRVHAWLHAQQIWFIQETCPRTIEQLTNYRWADSVAADGQMRRESVIKIDDDLCDAARYALMLWPELPERDVQQDSKRRLQDLPEEIRWQVERMRRVDGRATDPDDEYEPDDDDLTALDDEPQTDPLGDFYGHP